MQARVIHLNVNGREHQAAIMPNVTLLRVLREQLGYLDVKNGCEKGDCGACTVLLNGKPVNSCLVLAWQVDGAQIVTTAGLGNTSHPHPIQEAFADYKGMQSPAGEGLCNSNSLGLFLHGLVKFIPVPGHARHTFHRRLV